MLDIKEIEHLAKDVTLYDIVHAVKYIRQYFVLPKEEKLSHIVKAIRKIKRDFDLEDGELITPKLIKVMSFARCSCPDDIENLDVELATSDYNRWVPGMTLKWNVENFIDGLSKDDQIAIYNEMFKKASQIFNLKFERTNTSSNANLVITSSNRGELGSSQGVLAFAELCPKRDFTGQLVATFDLAEVWVNKNSNKRGIFLYNVGNHEILGHCCIGRHSSAKSALLFPYYSATVAELQEVDDIPRAINLYGRAKDSAPIPSPKPIPSPQPTPSPPNTDNLVELTVDGVKIKIEGNTVESAKLDGWRTIKIDG